MMVLAHTTQTRWLLKDILVVYLPNHTSHGPILVLFVYLVCDLVTRSAKLVKCQEEIDRQLFFWNTVVVER